MNKSMHIRDRAARGFVRARPMRRLIRAGTAPTIDGRTLDKSINAYRVFMEKVTARRSDDEVTLQTVRDGFISMCFIGSADPDASVSVHDRIIAGPGGDLPIRLYHPAVVKGRAPGIVWFHQGGGVIGGLDTDHTLCTNLAQRCGAVLVSVDYRLAPEFPLAARVLDAVTSYSWVIDHAEGLGIDPNRVVTAGASEGGRLATVVCQERRRAGLAQPLGQIMVYPGVDALAEGGSMASMSEAWPLSARVIAFFAGHNANSVDTSSAATDSTDEANHWYSPLRSPALAGLATAVIVTAGFDPLRDQGDAYAEALSAAGVRVVHRCEDSLPHSFTIMGGVSAEARRATDRLVGDVAALFALS